jgi:hypothetical protein
LWIKPDASENISASIIRAMDHSFVDKAKMVSETLGFYRKLTGIFALEEFIDFRCCESFRLYKNCHFAIV